MCAFAEDVALTIHPHPTLGEAMMESLQARARRSRSHREQVIDAQRSPPIASAASRTPMRTRCRNELVEARNAGRIGDTLLLLEHSRR